MRSLEFHLLLYGGRIAVGHQVADVLVVARTRIGCISRWIEQMFRNPDNSRLGRDLATHPEILATCTRQFRRRPVETVLCKCSTLMAGCKTGLVEKHCRQRTRCRRWQRVLWRRCRDDLRLPRRRRNWRYACRIMCRHDSNRSWWHRPIHIDDLQRVCVDSGLIQMQRLQQPPAHNDVPQQHDAQSDAAVAPVPVCIRASSPYSARSECVCVRVKRKLDAPTAVR
jgi:hypothetical protein